MHPRGTLSLRDRHGAPFNLDSTNMRPQNWVELVKIIRDKYESYDGFVITHGTDTMAYAAATLYYLIQNSPKCPSC